MGAHTLKYTRYDLKLNSRSQTVASQLDFPIAFLKSKKN